MVIFDFYLTKYDKTGKAIKMKNLVVKRGFITVTPERLERSANGLKGHCCTDDKAQPVSIKCIRNFDLIPNRLVLGKPNSVLKVQGEVENLYRKVCANFAIFLCTRVQKSSVRDIRFIFSLSTYR